MALIDEDGTGKADAESYASVAYVDAYLAARGRDTAWSAKSTTEQEQALREATSYLDRKYGERWEGTRYSSTQNLSHPRAYVVVDGYTLDVGTAGTLPQILQEATAELCYRISALASGESIFDLATTRGSVKATRDKVGPLETEVQYQGSATVDGYGSDGTRDFPDITQMLGPLLKGGGAFGRIERA